MHMQRGRESHMCVVTLLVVNTTLTPSIANDNPSISIHLSIYASIHAYTYVCMVQDLLACMQKRVFHVSTHGGLKRIFPRLFGFQACLSLSLFFQIHAKLHQSIHNNAKKISSSSTTHMWSNICGRNFAETVMTLWKIFTQVNNFFPSWPLHL